MTTDVKLLPLPDRHIVGQPCYFGSQMQSYARANMDPLIAENERLAEALRSLADNWDERCNTVLRQARDVDESELSQYHITAGALAGCAHELRAAIDQARGKGGGE